jgi:hypothetical protein
MVLRDAIIEAKLVEQLALIRLRRPILAPVLRRPFPQNESPFGVTLNAFIDSIGHERTSHVQSGTSAFGLEPDLER